MSIEYKVLSQFINIKWLIRENKVKLIKPMTFFDVDKLSCLNVSCFNIDAKLSGQKTSLDFDYFLFFA